MTQPRIAVTIGDPVGIGPEIVVGALHRYPDLCKICRIVIVGDGRVIRRAEHILGINLDLCTEYEIQDVPFEGAAELPYGVVSKKAGAAAACWIQTAAGMCMAGEVAAMVTAPIQKEALWAAGIHHPGHTELIASLTGATRAQTMFEVKGIRIFFATRHMSLRAAIDAITRQDQLRSIQDAMQALNIFGLPSPRLAVAALNPHGGESGHFGREEIDIIAPAIADAHAAGLRVFGPIPADSVFSIALAGKYDAVLAQYHDQGHIAAKTIDFDGTISVTMGLPILRTSVDHGTAFDIAGTGKARSAAMAAAIRAAARLAPFAGIVREVYGQPL